MTGTAEQVVPGPSNDADKVVAELRKVVRVTHGPTDHSAALASVADVLARSPRAYPRRQVTFFTDLQRASWANAIPHPENNTAEVWQRIASRADIAVVDTAAAGESRYSAVAPGKGIDRAQLAIQHAGPRVYVSGQAEASPEMAEATKKTC